MAEDPVKLRIDELAIPTAPGADGWAEFRRAVEIGNLVDAERYGTPDIGFEPTEELAQLQAVHKRERIWLARRGDEIVGRAGLTWIVDDPTGGWINNFVLPTARGLGIDEALADHVESAAREAGLPSVISYVGAPVPAAGIGLPSPTGFGTVPDDENARFLGGRGYTLEQVERVSRMALPIDGLDAQVTAALARSGPDYRLHTWVRRIPERWLDDIAVLATRMGTDAPTAGLEEPEDPWTAERVAAEDERRARTNPRTTITAAVEHLPTGRLVGFTDLSVPRQSHRAVLQYATLVLREHRGHRLGMLLKVANLAHLEREFPGHPSVITFNAEENRPMLDVNERLGFEAIAVEGAWQKKL